MLALLRSRGFWALGDQGVVSLGNFLTNVLLARFWFDRPADYGLYSLCNLVILFLNNLHSSLITYPLTVHGATGGLDSLRRITGHSLSLTALLAPVLGIGLVVVTGFSHRLSLLPWLVIAMVLWQTQETLRRAMLSRLWHLKALPGDALSYLGQAGVVFFLGKTGRLTLETAFISVAGTSLLAACLQAFQLRARPSPVQHLRPTAWASWRLGRWPLLTQLINLGLLYLTPWVLAAAWGNEEVAKFTAVATVLNLTNPVVVGICGLILPAVAAARAEQGPRAAVAITARYALVGAAVLIPYYALLLVAPHWVLGVFYGRSAYTGLTFELRLFVAGYAIYYISHVCSAALNGLQRARDTSIAMLIGAGANLILCMPLTIAYGLHGSVWGGLPPIAIQAFTLGSLLWRATHGRKSTTPQPGPRPDTTMQLPLAPVTAEPQPVPRPS